MEEVAYYSASLPGRSRQAAAAMNSWIHKPRGHKHAVLGTETCSLGGRNSSV